MDFVLQSLLWKEWRERRGTFFVCLAWILCGVVYVLLYESASGCRTPVSRYGAVCLIYSLCMSVFLAMRVSLSEVTDQTISFSRTLPVSLSRVAAVRLGMAIFALIVPILLGALVLLVFLASGLLEQVPARSEQFRSGSEIVAIPGVNQVLRASLSAGGAVSLLMKVACISISQTTALFLVLCLLGARRRNEVHVGFLGAVVAFVWFILLSVRGMFPAHSFPILHDYVGILFPQSLVMFSSYSAGGVSWNDLDLADRVWLPLFLNLFLQCGLAVWFTRRYGTQNAVPSVRKWHFWKVPPLFSLVSIPFSRPVFSLMWINLRQSVPLALAGLILAGIMVMMETLGSHPNANNHWELVKYNLPGSMWVLGMLWATVVGSGVVASELAPGLGHFWMSRPIPIRRWFWFKYLIGLLAVLFVLDGTTIAVSWNSLFLPPEEKMNYGAELLSWSYIACYPALHAMMYSLTVLGVCWWKKPVRGAVMPLAVFLIGSLVMESIPSITEFDPFFVYDNLHHAEREGEFDLSRSHFPVVFGTVCVITLLTAYLASRKVQRLEV
ncbi:hypothetical protein [uncultured Gimesia sp.]|jgi:hypothetical protein|uniref:hypothetical protein n=1 Tax=uncultured Gimesia sp. TaxID=1678688 RepID=UPI0026222AA2|nr:hypothetical protein [uncultured Gimesia sp.]